MDFDICDAFSDALWYRDDQESIINIGNYDKHNFLYQILLRNDCEIDPTSLDNVNKQTEELIKRYCYFYENAEVIIGQIVGEFGSNEYALSNRLASSIVLVLNDDNKPLMEKRNIDFLTLVEEAFLGEKPLEETRFYQIMERINNDPELFKESKKVYGRGVDLINDHNMLVLIEMIYFLVGVQKYAFLYEEVEEERYVFVQDKEEHPTVLTKFDCIEKQRVLSKYLEILFYQNKEFGRWSGCSSRTIYPGDEGALKRFIHSSLVGYNLFTGAFCDIKLSCDNDYSNVVMNRHQIPLEMLQRVHYKYHDELPWNMEIECNDDDTFQRPNNTSSCGNRILINEDALFTIGDKAYQICPKCGYIVLVNDIKPVIFNRVKKRCSEDKDYLLKMRLMSELISLGGVEEVKVKVK